MSNYKTTITNIERMIMESEDFAKRAKNASDISFGSFGCMEASDARKYASDAHYYANRANSELSTIVAEYNREVKALVGEINDMIDELNLVNDNIANMQHKVDEKELIAQIREIDIQAGTDWYKEVGSKKVAPLRKQLSTLSKEVTVSKKHEKEKLETNNVFRNTSSDLEKVRVYSDYAENYAKRADYEYSESEKKCQLQRCYDESLYAERRADDALYSFRREVSNLETNMGKLENKRSDIKNELNKAKYKESNMVQKEQLMDYKLDLLNVKREIEAKKQQLSSIYEKAGTTWYKEVGSKQAKQLRLEINQMEKRR